MFDDIKKILFLLNSKLRLSFLYLIFLVLVGTFLEMLSISMLFPILTILVGNLDSTVNFLNEKSLNFLVPFLELKKVLIIFITIYAVKVLFRLYIVHFQNNFIFSFFTFLLNRLFQNYIFKSYIFHIRNNIGKIIRNLMSEIHQCSVGYMGAITNIIIEFIVIIGLISILVFYKPLEVLSFIILTGIVSFSVILFLKRKSQQLGKDRQKFSLKNINYIMETFGGIKEIKINLKENQVINRFHENSINLKRTNYLFQVITQIPKLFLELLVVIAIVILLFYLISSGMDKEK